jgi:hypothetical protein
VNSGLSSPSFVIIASEPRVSTTLPPKPSKVTLSPFLRSFGPQPWRRIVFGLVSSRFQLVTLPSGPVTSTYTRMCGLVQATCVTTPLSFTRLLASYSVSNP